MNDMLIVDDEFRAARTDAEVQDLVKEALRGRRSVLIIPPGAAADGSDDGFVDDLLGHLAAPVVEARPAGRHRRPGRRPAATTSRREQPMSLLDRMKALEGNTSNWPRPADDDDVMAQAAALIVAYGQIDGDHHKLWVLDQVLRRLAGDEYRDVIAWACDGEDGPDTYGWDTGIAP